MTWRDRIQEAAYTSPSGTRVTWDFEDVGRQFKKRGAAYDFPGFDGSLVVPSGSSDFSFPVRIIVHGEDYDLEATRIEELLREDGVGTLEHPIYGTHQVVPMGDILRRDDLKSAANQATITVTFLKTVLDVYPSSAQDTASQTELSIEDFNNEAVDYFAEVVDPTEAGFRSRFRATVDGVAAGLQEIADVEDEISREFDSIKRDLDRTVDAFVTDPINLGFQTLRLIQLPSQIATGIGARLEAAGNLLSALTGAEYSETASINASGTVSYAVLSAVNAQFQTKTEALEAAGFLLDSFDQFTTWRQNALETDGSRVYESLQRSVALAAGFLVEISFTLKQERRVVLDRTRNCLELCAELYGTEAELDFLINSNDLSGSEILELPRGREIVYYL